MQISFIEEILTKYLVIKFDKNKLFTFLEGNHMVPQACTITWIFFLDMFAKLDRPDASHLVSSFIYHGIWILGSSLDFLRFLY